MDELLQQILRELTATNPAAAARLREILGQNLTALALLRALYQLLMENLIDRALLSRLLTWFARAGVLDAEMVNIAIAEAEADAARAAAQAGARAGRFARLLRWLRGGIWLALLYLLLAAIADSQVTLAHGPAGKGPCAVNATPVRVNADESSYGPKSALQDAMAEIQRKCGEAPVNCADPECKTCAKDAFVNSVEVKSRVFWYTAVVAADCRCWCK
jgi:hypothetical protein